MQFGFRNLMNRDIKYLNFTGGTSSEVNIKFVSSISLYMKYTVFSPSMLIFFKLVVFSLFSLLYR